MAAKSVKFRSNHRVHGTQLTYDFAGVEQNGQITGTVNLGEYGTAKFTARKA